MKKNKSSSGSVTLGSPARVTVRDFQSRRHKHDGWRYIAPEPVPPKTHAEFNAHYTQQMLSRGKVMRALIELYAEGKLDEMVEKKIREIELASGAACET